MTGHRDTTRIVRDWLEVGATALPDRVLDAVLDQVPLTRQRRPSLGQRVVGPHTARAFALAAVLAIAAAIIGLAYLNSPKVGTPPGGDATPNSATPVRLPDAGSLEPGTYWDPLPVPVTFDVPAALRACRIDEPAVCGASIATLSVGRITNVITDPCQSAPIPRDPPVGPSVEDLVAALGELPGFQVDNVRPVVVDGYRGTELEITAPAVTCQLSPWSSPYRVNGVAAEETNRLRIVDVGGTRVVLALAYHPTTPPADLTALTQVMDSVRFGAPPS